MRFVGLILLINKKLKLEMIIKTTSIKHTQNPSHKLILGKVQVIEQLKNYVYASCVT